MIRKVILLTSLFTLVSRTEEKAPIVCDTGEKSMKIQDGHAVQKKQLSNGMTVLVRPVHSIPKVSIQLWYNVGSKDEKSGEKESLISLST